MWRIDFLLDSLYLFFDFYQFLRSFCGFLNVASVTSQESLGCSYYIVKKRIFEEPEGVVIVSQNQC